jgi:hypothetical protein
MTAVPDDNRKKVWVRKEPDGKPQECYADSIGHAFDLGYVLCDAPGVEPKTPTALTIAPDLTATDLEEAESRVRTVGTDNSAAIIEPVEDDEPEAPRRGKGRNAGRL